MNFYFPTEIIIGDNCVRENASKLKALDERCLIVTGKGSAKACGALQDVTSALESVGVSYQIYDKITQNPLYITCADGAVCARECNAQFIIGIGGGSPLDAAKAIACLAPNPKAGEHDMYAQTLVNPPLPVVAVGTTAGTGSEVTQVAVITATDGMKKSFRANSSFPVLALGDARYTEYMPESVARSTAVDALSHCIESYFNLTANGFSEMFALKGAKMIIDEFWKLQDGFTPDKDQRDALYLASVYGGVAISVTGTCIPHALGYFLSESHNVPHGTACAFWLPQFIEHNEKYARARSDNFFEYVNSTPQKLCALIEKITPKTDIVVSPEELESLRPRWVNNSCLKKAYGNIDNIFLETLLEKAFINQEDE